MAASLLIGAISPAFAFKIAYTVGSDGACDYTTIADALTAVAANPSLPRIYVAVNAATGAGQKVVINNLDVTITGGFSSCSDSFSPTTNTTISGAGNGGEDSVFFITGTSNVTLAHLTITGGNLSDRDGAGVSFFGNGSLLLSSVSVSNNKAANGAGIDIHGNGGNLTATIGAGTFVTGNIASDSGGGIRVEGSARLFILEDGILVAQNQALGGNGGGLEVIGPARADIGSSGDGQLGVLYGNTAVNGGGAAVLAGQDSGLEAVLRVFSTDAKRPVRISNNAASAFGGGVYLKSYAGFDGTVVVATFCAQDYRIDTNAASEGTATYADSDSSIYGSHAASVVVLGYEINSLYDDICGPEPPASLGWISCTGQPDCSLIDGNVAAQIDNNNAPTDGATLYGNTDVGIDQLYAFGVKVRGNVGGYALRQSGGAYLNSCLFAENQLQHELLRYEDGSVAGLTNCTLANDLIGSAYAIHAGSQAYLTNLVVDESGTLAMDFTGGAGPLSVSNVLSNDISTLPADPNTIAGDPMFFDLAHGDYRLRAMRAGNTIVASPAIDFAATVVGLDNDVGGRPYDQDTAIPNRGQGTVRDLGAYEMQPIADRIFGDGFGDPISIVF